MTKKLIYGLSILLLCLIMIFGGIYSWQRFEDYEQIELKISDVEAEYQLTINEQFAFENSNLKFHNEKIEKDFIYGYRHVYKRDDITFYSLSKDWDEEKLSELANELLLNGHGDEIGYLDKVIIQEYSGGDAAGTHSRSYYVYEFPMSLYNFIPDELHYDTLCIKSTIFIYVADDDEIEDIATVLSHEYGHHYTYFNFGLNGDESDLESEYYKLRAAEYEEVVTERESYSEYLKDHEWYLVEMAAEDYVLLMGSPNTKITRKYYDHFDKCSMYFNGVTNAVYKSRYKIISSYNATPMENANIEMPFNVDGLIDYYYSFVDSEPSFVEYEPLGTLNLRIAMPMHHRISFKWDRPYADPDVVYTLLAYDEEGELVLVHKSINGDDNSVSRYGNFLGLSGHINLDKKKDYKEYFEYMNMYADILNDKEYTTWTYRLSVVFPDGTVLMSDALSWDEMYEEMVKQNEE